MMTGWQQINGKWYYLNSDGDMAIGWIQPQLESGIIFIATAAWR